MFNFDFSRLRNVGKANGRLGKTIENPGGRQA